MTLNTSNKINDSSTSVSPLSRRSVVVADSLQFLDDLKDLLFERLGRIESLARLAVIDIGAEPADPSKVEETLRDRVLALEAAQSRLLAAEARRDQEWREFLEDLEADRELLARSWQELERERLRSPAQSAAELVQRPRERPISKPADGRGDPAADPHASDVISREILRQFRALQDDVRRNSKT